MFPSCFRSITAPTLKQEKALGNVLSSVLFDVSTAQVPVSLPPSQYIYVCWEPMQLDIRNFSGTKSTAATGCSEYPRNFFGGKRNSYFSRNSTELHITLSSTNAFKRFVKGCRLYNECVFPDICLESMICDQIWKRLTCKACLWSPARLSLLHAISGRLMQKQGSFLSNWLINTGRHFIRPLMSVRTDSVTSHRQLLKSFAHSRSYSKIHLASCFIASF